MQLAKNAIGMARCPSEWRTFRFTYEFI